MSHGGAVDGGHHSKVENRTVATKPKRKDTAKSKAGAGDWRVETLDHMRALILAADPEVVEEWKWRKASSPGTPVWSHGGLVCTGETYKNAVKLTFARGASIPDPSRLFNASLEGGTRRAIDIHEGDKVDEAALKDLIRAAVALNLKGKSKPKAAS